jgi:hypothetical protein
MELLFIHANTGSSKNGYEVSVFKNALKIGFGFFFLIK